MAEHTFNCPYCGEEISCDSSYIGYKAECPFCHRKFLVPGEPALASVEVAQETEEVAETGHRNPVKQKRIKNSAVLLCTIGFLGAMVAGLMIVVAWLFLTRDTKQLAVETSHVTEDKMVANGKPISVKKPQPEQSAKDQLMTSSDALKMCVTISCVSGVGSGFFVMQGGQLRVVTCRHVVEDEPIVVVKDINGNQYEIAQISISKDRDVAVIDLVPPFYDTSYFKVASDVSSVGLNTDLACYGDSEGTGVIVPCYGKLLGIGPNSVETDAPFVPGNSGGPVVSKSGHEVVGVASILTRLNEGNKWVKGTRFEKQTRHFAVRIDNLNWAKLEKTDDGAVKENDLERINEIAAQALKNGDVDKAIALYSYAADKNNSKAINTLGEFFVVRGKKDDIDDAVKLFRKAAENGLPEGKINLGLCHLYGRGVRKNSTEAFDSFKEASENGNPYATYLMGMCFRDGQGVEKSIAEAVRCFEMAADRGEMHAQNALGDCYWEGVGVGKNWNKAFELFKSSAEQKYAEAEWNMGFSYEHEIGVKKDMVIAAQWYLKSAEQGYGRAQDKMGDLYLNGEGVPKDYDKMFYWYSKAAEQGIPGAEYSVGLAYLNGNGVSRDLSRAFSWLERAANDGYVPALNEVGNCFYNGNGVSKNVREAVSWYKRAAGKGYKIAMRSLGYLYKNGDGVERDFGHALYWMEQYGDAAEIRDLKIAAGNYFYDRNKDLAATWWSQTNDKNYWNKVGVIYYDSERYTEAFKWFTKAAGSPYERSAVGNEWAMINAGRCYLYGRGVEQNKFIARECFSRVLRSEDNEVRKTANQLWRETF